MCRMNAVMCMLCVVRKMGTSSIFSCRTGVPHFYAGTGMSRKTFFSVGRRRLGTCTRVSRSGSRAAYSCSLSKGGNFRDGTRSTERGYDRESASVGSEEKGE